MELNKIYKMDCLEGLRSIEDNSIDCIVTSPPYNKIGLKGGVSKEKTRGNSWNVQIDYDTFSDNMTEFEYEKWQIEILDECYRVLKPTGSLFYNHKIRRHNSEAFFPKWIFETKLKFYQMITWDRQVMCDAKELYLYPTTELIFWMVKDKPKVFRNQATHKSEVWKILPSREKEHPAPFPKEIPTNCINLTTEENDVVLDPFSGIGTTVCCAKSLSRKYIGFEISENYVAKTEKRLKEIGGLDSLNLL